MTSLKVLYVDDEADIREVATMSLEMDPTIEVRTAGSAAEALALLGKGDWRPDLLLLDVMMPTMDGPGLLKEIRARPAMADIPAVFITARAHPQEQQQFLSAGAVAVIAKPFDPLSLAAEVRSVAGRAG
jgi:two-component system OmpR family response regulator